MADGLDFSRNFAQAVLKSRFDRFDKLVSAPQRENRNLSGDEEREVAEMIDELVQARETLPGIPAQDIVGELRFTLETVGRDDPNTAILLANNILEDSDMLDLEVVRVGKEGLFGDKPAFAIRNKDTDQFMDIDPEGFDASDLKAFQAGSVNALPITGSVVGGGLGALAGAASGFLGGPGGMLTGAARGAGPGAGAGGILGGTFAQNVREDLEQKHAPFRENNRLEGLLGAAGTEVVANIIGLGFGKFLLGPAIKASSPLIANVAGKMGVTDEVAGRAMQFLQKPILEGGEAIAKTPGAKQLAGGANLLLDKVAANPFGALMLGVEQVAEDTLETAMSQGMNKEQIKSLLRNNLDKLRLNMRQAKKIIAQEQMNLGVGRPELEAKLNADRSLIDSMQERLFANADAAIDSINAKYDLQLDELIAAKQAGDQPRIDKIKADIFDIDQQLKGFDDEMLSLKKMAGFTDAEKKAAKIAPETLPQEKEFQGLLQLVDSTGDDQAPGVGRQLQNKVRDAWLKGIDEERAAFDLARSLSEGETEAIVDIKTLRNTIDKGVSDRALKNQILKEVPLNGKVSAKQLVSLGRKLNDTIREGKALGSGPAISASDRAVLSGARNTLMTGESSVYSEAANLSPAIAQWQQGGAKLIKRNDAIQDTSFKAIFGNSGVDFTTGKVDRNLINPEKAIEGYAELKKSPETFALLKEYAGIDESLNDQATLAYMKDIYRKSGQNATKTLEVFEKNPRAVEDSALGNRALTQLQDVRTQRQELGVEDVFADARAKRQALELEASRKGAMERKKLFQADLSGAEKELESGVKDITKEQQALRQGEIGSIENLSGVDALDQAVKGVKDGSEAGVKQAQETLDLAGATPEERQALFRAKFLDDPLSTLNAKNPETDLGKLNESLKGATFEGQAQPNRFNPFGDVSEDLGQVSDLAESQQRLNDTLGFETLLDDLKTRTTDQGLSTNVLFNPFRAAANTMRGTADIAQDFLSQPVPSVPSQMITRGFRDAPALMQDGTSTGDDVILEDNVNPKEAFDFTQTKLPEPERNPFNMLLGTLGLQSLKGGR